MPGKKNVITMKFETEREARSVHKLYKDVVDDLSDYQAISYDHSSLIAVGRIGVKASYFLCILFLFKRFSCILTGKATIQDHSVSIWHLSVKSSMYGKSFEKLLYKVDYM